VATVLLGRSLCNSSQQANLLSLSAKQKNLQKKISLLEEQLETPEHISV
jgi:hypothetical protein